MGLPGFDPEYADLPAWIEGITERIWEGRGVGLIRRWYSDDCLVHTTNGPIRGMEAVVAGTLDTLHAFPDRRLLAEDVIWSQEPDGYLSSHRVLTPGRHDGPSFLGDATGRELSFRSMADCRCVENKVVEEWLSRDVAGIALQIGQDPQDLAERLAMPDIVAGRDPWHLEPARSLRTGTPFRPPVLQDHPAAALVREVMDAVWNRAEVNAVREHYHPACTVHAPGAKTLHGTARVDRFVVGWLSSFPDLRLHVEHSIALEEPGQTTRVATRWWATGTHTGHGHFGPATGASVLVLGIVHSIVVAGRIREEFVVVDEVGVRRQIAQQRG